MMAEDSIVFICFFACLLIYFGSCLLAYWFFPLFLPYLEQISEIKEQQLKYGESNISKNGGIGISELVPSPETSI